MMVCVVLIISFIFLEDFILRHIARPSHIAFIIALTGCMSSGTDYEPTSQNRKFSVPYCWLTGAVGNCFFDRATRDEIENREVLKTLALSGVPDGVGVPNGVARPFSSWV